AHRGESRGRPRVGRIGAVNGSERPNNLLVIGVGAGLLGSRPQGFSQTDSVVISRLGLLTGTGSSGERKSDPGQRCEPKQSTPMQHPSGYRSRKNAGLVR